MALTDFLTDIANAIRYAEGSVGTINAQDFADRIRALQGGAPLPTTGVTLTMIFDNDIPSNCSGSIVLFTDSEDMEGNYDLYWANEDGIMDNYTKLNVYTELPLVSSTSLTYQKLNNFNAIPKYATKLVAVKSDDLQRNIVATYNIPSSKLWDESVFGEHLYSVGVLSDIHLQYETGENDVEVALSYLNERESVEAIVCDGDYTKEGTETELNEWKTCRDTNADSTPVYGCTGNHEMYKSISLGVTNPSALRQYLDTDYVDETTNYFKKIINNDVYIFVPEFEGNTPSVDVEMFSNETLQSLENDLETYRNQRVFIFAHVPPSKYVISNGFATGNGAYSSNIWGYGTQLQDRIKFLNLLKHYKNAIWFSGHTHIKYQYQETWTPLNIMQYEEASHFIHVSSLTVPRDIINGSARDLIYAESEGSVMDVYPNHIRIRCRNFVDAKFYGLCEYIIDTTPHEVDPQEGLIIYPNVRIRGDGSEQTDANYAASNYIEIEADKTYTVSLLNSFSASRPTVSISYYTSNDSTGFISTTSALLRGSTATTAVISNIPANARFFRLSIYTENLGDVSQGFISLSVE